MKSEKEIFENYTKQRKQLMNPSINPCEDFSGYACGSMKHNNYDIPPYNFLFTTEKILENKIAEFPSLIKARNFYKSCQSETEFRKFLDKIELDHQIGGWPAYEKNWSGKNFDWIKVSASLAAVGLQTFLKHTTEYSLNERIINVCSKKPKDESHAFEVLRKLGVCEIDISNVISDIDSIVEKIKSIPRISYPRRNVVKTILKTSFDKLRKSPDFDYIKYFETYIGQPLIKTDFCNLENDKHLAEVLKIFLESKPECVANYIFFEAGRQFLNGKFHLNLTIDFFMPALIASGFSAYFSENDKRKHFEILERFSKSFDKIKDKFSAEAESQVKSYWQRDYETLEFKNLHFQQKIIESDYETVEIDPINFHQNFINLQKCYPTSAHKICFSEDFNTRNNCNALFTLLGHITFNHEKPMLHHFIGNGFRMWRDVIYSFSDSVENSDKISDIILKKQIDENKLPECYNVIKLGKAYTLALDQLHKDYKLWLKENQEMAAEYENILKPLGINMNQMFFISFGQRDFHKEEEAKTPAFLALLNMKGFTDAFQCKIGTNMCKSGKFLV